MDNKNEVHIYNGIVFSKKNVDLIEIESRGWGE
jgi:hypothetical protein